MQCPQCQRENPGDARFCTGCGSSLELVCPACRMSNATDSRFCKACGKPLSVTATPQADLRAATPQAYTPKHLAERILTSRAALEGERKRVTVLFCDLASSTALADRLGPEAMHTLLNQFFELSLSEVHRYEGTINQFLGDGFMALFGAPIAVEDHARRAVLAALGIQQSVTEQQAALASPSGEEFAVRMGLNTGVVMVGTIGDNLRMDYTAVGDTTNLAARLQELAEPGTILLSEAAARLVRGYGRVEALKPVEVKGRTEPVTAYRLLGLAPRRSLVETLEGRALSPFVGRGREMAALHDLLAQAESGQGQVVGLVGEAGAGKSRLLYEFRQSLKERKVTFLEGHCLSYGKAIPYLPVLEVLRDNCGVTETDDPEAITEKVRFALQEVGMDPDEGTPYLLNLLGVREGTGELAVLSPEAIKARTFETLRQMALKGSRKRPLILAVENLHWIDKTSEEHFASLVESLAGAPILLLGTHRPGYRPPWIEKSSANQVALSRLTPQQSLSVVHSSLARERLPDDMAELILAKAEGNPFFLEELTRVVAETAGDRLELELPDTIHGVLMARIDRLPDAPKKLLQTASVLGREVPLRLLEAIWEGPETLEPHLAELKRLEFLYGRSEAEEPVYTFKHALTQEVAYESLLVSRRQALHKAAGDAVEALYADHLEEAYDRLSYHYSRTDEAEKAIDYLTRFAEKAAGGYSHAESVTALQEAIAHAERLPDDRERDRVIIDLVLRQADSFYFLGRFRESLKSLLDNQECLEQLQDPSMAGPYYFWLGYTYGHLGDQERAEQSAQRAIEEAERCGDEATLGKAHYLLSRVAWWLGRSRQGAEQGRQAVALLERTKERWWQGQAHLYPGISYWVMGEFESALEVMGRMRAIGESIGDPRLQTYAAWSIGGIHTQMGDWKTGIEYSKWALEHSTDPMNTANALVFLGYAYLEKGDLAQAIPPLEQAVQLWRQFRAPHNESYSTALLGQAYLLSGQADKAWDLAIQGLEIARGVGYQWGVGNAQRVLGLTARARGDLSKAELHLNQALDTLASIEASYWIGRVHLDLAELAHVQGKGDSAAKHLKQAHDMFRALNVPNYVQRAEQLAREYGIRLPEGSAGAEM